MIRIVYFVILTLNEVIFPDSTSGSAGSFREKRRKQEIMTLKLPNANFFFIEKFGIQDVMSRDN
jgi:hypothetical protein